MHQERSEDSAEEIARRYIRLADECLARALAERGGAKEPRPNDEPAVHVGSGDVVGDRGEYAVACVLTSGGWAGNKIALCHSLVTAASEDEARGTATRDALETNKDYSLLLVSVMNASPNNADEQRAQRTEK